MKPKSEKNVFELRVPACAVIEKMIYSPKHGFVAATMNCDGNQLTFFRTDFLTLERVAWDCNEVLTGRGFHEEISEGILEAITKNGGFFISRNLLSVSNDGKAVSSGNEPASKMLYTEAEELSKSLNIPELESDIPFGAIYDTLGNWFIQTGAITEKEWIWSPESKEEQQMLMNRDCGGWNLADLIDDIFATEWTKESFLENSHITREGVPFSDGEANYPARKRYIYSEEFRHPKAKVRAFLYFK